MEHFQLIASLKWSEYRAEYHWKDLENAGDDGRMNIQWAYIIINIINLAQWFLSLHAY